MLKDRAEKTKGLWEGFNSEQKETDTDNNVDASVDVDSDVNANINTESNVNKNSDENEDSTVTTSEYEQLLKKKKTEDLVMKGLYLRKDQVDSLKKYSKLSKKSYSEFVRDALDIVFSELKKNQ